MIPEIATAIVTEMPKAIGIKPRAVAAIDMPNTFPIRKQIGPFIGLFPFQDEYSFRKDHESNYVHCVNSNVGIHGFDSYFVDYL